MKFFETNFKTNLCSLSFILLIVILLIVGCEESTSPVPVAKFAADKTNVLMGETIYFTDKSQNEPTSWLWSFGDGNTSTEKAPEHIYNTAGYYTVELKATNEGGTDSEKKIDYINIIQTGTLTDIRDNNSYKTVEIGNQVWMAENLKYLPSLNTAPDHSYTVPMYYVYNYAGTDINEAILTQEYLNYGVLYNWSALMNGELSSDTNPSGIQGVCPTDWHVPSKAEWYEMIDFLGGSSIAGGKLKEQGSLHWSNNYNATNETGFTGLAGGGVYAYTEDGYFKLPEFAFLKEYGVFWTSTGYESDDKIAWFWHLNNIDAEITPSNLTNSKGDGFSVRCIKD